MRYDTIIVGGGIAGLTSAAYLTKAGYKVLLCEKEATVGGLVSSFYYDGFLYDAGVRNILDSGIIKPMLKQLNIDVEFVKSLVSIGIEKELIFIKNMDSLNDYREMLVKLYPENETDIDIILNHIREVMDYMDVLYGIENPLFIDLKKDKKYLFHKLIPWLFRFMKKSGKISKFKEPVDEYLKKLTSNQSLIDIISQHFFQKTPASFALSYFSLYLDYEYPVKGTFNLIEKIKEFVIASGGIITTKTEIKKIDYVNKILYDQNNNPYQYDQLIWAADTISLYKSIDTKNISDKKTKEKIEKRKELIQNKRGCDSIYSLFLAVDLDQDYFSKRSSGHCFYTPKKIGHSKVFNRLKEISTSTDKQAIIDWMREYLEYTTYEISIPAMRNKELAPSGKTGIIVSVLMDYDFITNIKNLGFYQEFKEIAEKKIIEVLSETIYDQLKDYVIHRFSSSPLTIERLSANHDGAITGWAFTNDVIPAKTKMTHIKMACETSIPNIHQAGQWTFSPSGLPVSIMTGKIAADRTISVLEKRKKKIKKNQ